MPFLATLGAGSLGAYRLFRPSGITPVFIEDVFSTYLYTGQGTSKYLTITNGIDIGNSASSWTSSSYSLTSYGTSSSDVNGTYYSVFRNGSDSLLVRFDSSHNKMAELTITSFAATDVAYDGTHVAVVGNGTGANANDIILAKFNNSFVRQFDTKITSAFTNTAKKVLIESDGTVIIAFDNATQAHLYAYNMSGSVLWNKRYYKTTSSNQESTLFEFKSGGDGHVYISGGATFVTTSFKEVYVAKIASANGNLQWTYSAYNGYGSTSNRISGLAVTSNAVYVSANEYGLYGGSTYSKPWFAKINLSGTEQWTKDLYSEAPISTTDIKLASDGTNLYAAYYNGLLGENNNALIKYDTNGTILDQSIIQDTTDGNLGAPANIVIRDGKINFNYATKSLKLNTDFTTSQGNTGTVSLRTGLAAFTSSSITTYYSGGTLTTETTTRTSVGSSNTTSSSNTTTFTVTNTTVASRTASNGLVWIKKRSGTSDHALFDTLRGKQKRLISNLASAQTGPVGTTDDISFNNNGFSFGSSGATFNEASSTFTSWTFRKQAKFFDVVTYTGNGGTAQTISHNLGSTPGCIIIKALSGSEDWIVYHRALSSPTTEALLLNSTAAASAYYSGQSWDGTAPTSTGFTVKIANANNSNGVTYVAYLFAHNAGGFGASGTDNVISCGTFTDASGAINLGYEPQFLLYKCSSTTGDWTIVDNMRGMPVSGNQRLLYPNTSGGEATGFSPYPTATGFQVQGLTTGTYIYIAIRRGPMKTPTSGTSVFSATTRTGTSSTITVSGLPFPTDALFVGRRTTTAAVTVVDRLRGAGRDLLTRSTGAEGSGNINNSFTQNGYELNATTDGNGSGDNFVDWNFRRAPGFFDVVIPTSTSTGTVNNPHNLGVTPELVIFKARGAVQDWYVEGSVIGAIGSYQCYLNLTNGRTASALIQALSATNVTTSGMNPSAYVFYLFATVAGVSKVGSYTGTGSTLSIDCGFTAGARFVMIKRTDSTGDWYVWDTARGIVSGNDPYLLMNSTAVEVTNTDYIDPYNPGFELSSTAPAAINANGGTYIYLAIA